MTSVENHSQSSVFFPVLGSVTLLAGFLILGVFGLMGFMIRFNAGTIAGAAYGLILMGLAIGVRKRRPPAIQAFRVLLMLSVIVLAMSCVLTLANPDFSSLRLNFFSGFINPGTAGSRSRPIGEWSSIFLSLPILAIQIAVVKISGNLLPKTGAITYPPA